MPYDLNKPAFGPNADIISTTDLGDTTPADAKEVNGSSDDAADDGEEEGRVKYSRFKKFHNRAIEAEKEAAYWREKAETRTSSESTSVDGSAFGLSYQEFTELYGDSEAAQKAWKIQQTAQERLFSDLKRQAQEVAETQQERASQAVQENVDDLDDRLDTLVDTIGRDLTDKEQMAILDIVDDYTPKDRNGNYMGPLLSFEKAYKIYELEGKASSAPKKASRDAVANLTGSHGSGETTTERQERDKNFNPLDWNAWRNRI